MDKQISLQVEAVQVSLYCDIIKNILVKHRELSIIKLLTFSFVIKKNECTKMKCFSALDKKDLVLKFLSQVTGRYSEYLLQLEYGIEALDILIDNGICSLHENEVLCNLPCDEHVDTYGSFTSSAIEESKAFTDRQFLKEVVSIV